MAAKRKSALRSIGPSGIPTPLDDLKTQLASISTALTEELAALLATVLDDGRKETFDRLSQALSDAVPEFLQRAFEQELLASGKSASKCRASFVAVLRATHKQTRATSEKETQIVLSAVSATARTPRPADCFYRGRAAE
jgi:CheY-like chemotaxis protein